MKKLIVIVVLVVMVFGVMGCNNPAGGGSTHEKAIMVGTQNGVIIAGIEGTTTFNVTTENINNGLTGTVMWFSNTAGTIPVGSAPDGIEASVSILTNNTATVTMNAYGTTHIPGPGYFRIIIDEVQSNLRTLTIGSAGGDDDTGDGSEDNPFLVGSAADLQKIGTGTGGWSLDKNYKQTANINLSGISNWIPIGGLIANPFTGVYDGAGFSINDLVITGANHSQGLFAAIGADGVIRNVALRNVNIDSTGSKIGGLTGENMGLITNSYVSGTIKGSMWVGGITGSNEANGRIENCYTTCNVTGAGDFIGGIAGMNSSTGTDNAIIGNSYATGIIIGANHVGGITGSNNKTIRQNVALNRVISATGGTNLGRVAGSNNGGTFNNNFAKSGTGNEVNMWDITGPHTTPPAPDAAGIHGANAAAVQTHGADSNTWWSSSTNSPVFSSDNWSFEANRLPHLLTDEGGAFSEAQNPAVN